MFPLQDPVATSAHCVTGAMPPEAMSVWPWPRHLRLIAEYPTLLAKLWILNMPAATPRASGEEEAPHDLAALLAEQARLCDDLGPELAAAVSALSARAWSKMWNRCPWCGREGGLHATEESGPP